MSPDFIDDVCRQVLREHVRATTRCRKGDVVRNAVQALMPLAINIAGEQRYPSSIRRKECLARLSVKLGERIPPATMHAAVNSAGRQASRKKARERRNGNNHKLRGGSRGIALAIGR